MPRITLSLWRGGRSAPSYHYVAAASRYFTRRAILGNMTNTPFHAFRLVRLDNDESFEVALGEVVIGRGVDADITVSDSTLSRRHAQLERMGDRLRVQDLNSSNGTFLSGKRVADGMLADGETITFGQVSFRLDVVASSPDWLEAMTSIDATIVHQRPVHEPATGSLAVMDGTSVISTASLRAGQELTQRKLALLLDVSTGLSRVGSVDALLEQVADYVFQTMDVHRLAILLTGDGGELITRVARDRQGGDTARVVPRSIAQRVVDEKIAVVSANAPDDQRFAGESIVMQSVRSAMCAPLIGMEGTVLGVLYVDNQAITQLFHDDDLAFLVAFCGIAAVAIENGRYGERIQREALARGNFERFFAPALAARIASSTDALRLGGDKRRVVVLFSDIRGFTSLSETMPPDEIAALLSEYFTAMVDCVFRHGGTLDKFIGDAIMAQWGAPVAQDDDADRALAASFDMLDALADLNAEWRARGRAELRIGIGLNAGEVFAGYVGSERRLEYTVLGDAVNVASRLCSAAAGGEILITEELLRELKTLPDVQPRTGLQLKNVGRAVGVYAVSAHPA